MFNRIVKLYIKKRIYLFELFVRGINSRCLKASKGCYFAVVKLSNRMYNNSWFKGLGIR